LSELVGGKVMKDGEESYLKLTRMIGDDNSIKVLNNRSEIRKDGRLVVRPFYHDLGESILKTIKDDAFLRIYVTGTPGVGKSTFRNYLAWKILQNFRNLSAAVRIAMHKGGQDSFYLLCLEKDGSFRVELWCIVDTILARGEFKLGVNFFGLSDVSKGNVEKCDAFSGGSVMFSSPNKNAWAQGGKEDCKFFFMPLWEEEELCRFDTPARMYKERFDKYGGVARVVWGSDYTVQLHESRLKEAVADFKDMQAEVESAALWEKSHRFVYLMVEKDDNNAYMFESTPRLLIPTRHLVNIVADKYIYGALDVIRNMFDLRHPSVNGILFEGVALRLIENHALSCTFHVHRSTVGVQFPLMKGDFMKIPEALETFYFDDKDFLNVITTKTNVLALPKSQYFAGFDGAIAFEAINSETKQNENYLAFLQVTTADKHPLSAKGLQILVSAHAVTHAAKIQTKRRAKPFFKKIIIIYVLPNKASLKPFGLQQLKSPVPNSIEFNNTPQVTMCIGISEEFERVPKKAKTSGGAEDS
jgi:hypothetical protein